MTIETADLRTINLAEYDPETDMLKVVIICRSTDLRLQNGISHVDVDLDTLADRLSK